MTTDLAGNIYLTGFVNTSKTDVDYQTLKYRPDGRLLWEQRYNGPGNDLDRAQAIAVDDTGNVYITGESDGGKGEGPERLNSLDIATIKYSPDGKQLWVRRYDGPGHGMDSGRQIRLDGAGTSMCSDNPGAATYRQRAGSISSCSSMLRTARFCGSNVTPREPESRGQPGR